MKTINLRRFCVRGGYLVPVLAGLFCILAGIVDAQSVNSAVNVSEQYLKAAADQERAALGLPPLRLDAALSNAATRHAALMVEHNSISHQYPGEPDLSHRASDAGARFSLITENVAQAPSAILVHSAWMHSEGHRHNLLDPNVDSVGISVISRRGQMFAVEDFARSVASLSVQQQEGYVATAVREAGNGIAIDGADEDARKICSVGRDAETAISPQFVMRYTTDNLEKLPDELKTRLKSGRYGRAVVAACAAEGRQEFTMYRLAVLLYRSDEQGR